MKRIEILIAGNQRRQCQRCFKLVAVGILEDMYFHGSIIIELQLSGKKQAREEIFKKGKRLKSSEEQ